MDRNRQRSSGPLGTRLQCLWYIGLFKPIASELGFSRTMTSVASSIGRLEGGLEAPITGWITDRFGPKWIVFLGTFLVSLSLILMYFIQSLWSFYIVWGLMLGTGVNTALSVPLDASISKWFIKKRGIALSIKWVFSGASGAVVLPLIAWLISHCRLAVCLFNRGTGYGVHRPAAGPFMF